jgi:TIR domain-containing protein
METIKTFISHASGESELGNLIKTHIDAAFIGMVDVYVSSDGTSIAVGDNWMNSVVSHLQQADIFIVLCSQHSLDRPWINLELGAALTRGKTIIPLCHTDLVAAQLVRRPLSDFEALNASDPQGLKSLFTKLADALGSRVPAVDWVRLVSEVRAFESRYLAQKQTISQAKLQNRSPEIADLALAAPEVLCVSSVQFQSTVREDLDMINAAFPNQAHHEVITTSKELADLLVRKHFDVIHVAAFVCPSSGDLVFSAVDPLTKQDLERPRDELSAEQFMALVLESGASLVVLANNETLALVTKLLQVTSVVFALEPVPSKALAAWIASFYDFLSDGCTLRESCRKAFAQHQLPMTLYPRLPMTITANGGLQVDDSQQRLEPAGQFAMAN